MTAKSVRNACFNFPPQVELAILFLVQMLADVKWRFVDMSLVSKSKAVLFDPNDL